MVEIAGKGRRMKPYSFKVIFTGNISVTVSAFNEVEAKILAQAEQIQKGGPWSEISKIIKLD